MKLKIDDIAFPEYYVREKFDQKRVDDFIQIAAGLAPDQDPKNPKVKEWPFPAIMVYKIAPEAGKSLDIEAKGKKKTKELKSYILIDGRHRIEAANLLKMKEIDAEIKNVKDARTAYVEQFRANSTGPLQFNAVARANAIWTMAHVFHVQQRDIVKETGLHKASISRIVSRKQGWGKESLKPKKKEAPATGAPEWLPSQLFDRLFLMTGSEGYFKIKKNFLDYAKNQASSAQVVNLADNLRIISADLFKLTAIEKKPEAPKPEAPKASTDKVTNGKPPELQRTAS